MSSKVRYFPTGILSDMRAAGHLLSGRAGNAFYTCGVVHFPQGICDTCSLRSQCTMSSQGRSVSIHPDESLLAELREGQLTPIGRAKLRERVAVEHYIVSYRALARKTGTLSRSTQKPL